MCLPTPPSWPEVCILLFCQIHLLGRGVFWWSLWGFLCIVSCDLQTVTVLLPLSNLDPFYFCICLIAVFRTYNTMLNRSGESGHPCFVPDLKPNISSNASLER